MPSRRPLLNTGTALCLLFSVGLVAFWVRGHREIDFVGRSTVYFSGAKDVDERVGLFSEKGRIAIGSAAFAEVNVRGGVAGERWGFVRDQTNQAFSTGGIPRPFGFGVISRRELAPAAAGYGPFFRRRIDVIAVPFWFPLALALALPAWRWRRAPVNLAANLFRRVPPGYCRRCGRALPAGASCCQICFPGRRQVERTRGRGACRRHTLLNAATVACLLVGAAVLVFWIRSYATDDFVGRERVEGVPTYTERTLLRGVVSAEGSLLIGRGELVCYRFWPPGPPPPSREGITWLRGECGWFWARRADETSPRPFGFGSVRSTWRASGRRRVYERFIERRFVAVPYWFVAVAVLALPACRAGTVARVLARLFSRPVLPGVCAACGYDLRATPDALGPLLERCPECGRETHFSCLRRRATITPT